MTSSFGLFDLVIYDYLAKAVSQGWSIAGLVARPSGGSRVAHGPKGNALAGVWRGASIPRTCERPRTQWI
jgi:hypothetical protein